MLYIHSARTVHKGTCTHGCTRTLPPTAQSVPVHQGHMAFSIRMSH